VNQEHDGIIRHGAKLLYAYCNATVPRISIVLRKAYGGAYIVMDSRSVGCDLSYAWPTNEIAVMGAEGAANVVFRKEIAAADDPEATRRRLVKEYQTELMHPYYAAERGLVDDVIDPAETRTVLIRSLYMLQSKHADLPQRKHGNPPQRPARSPPALPRRSARRILAPPGAPRLRPRPAQLAALNPGLVGARPLWLTDREIELEQQAAGCPDVLAGDPAGFGTG
jgi:hypothetical protein